MGITVVYDATHTNIASLPAGKRAGYVTGKDGVQWLAEDWQANPDAIRIDQSPLSTVWDATADVDDYEKGAVSLNELAPRAKLRMAAYKTGTRPGQRTPLVYASASSLTDVCNALVSGGVTSGVGLWVANWNLTEPQSIAEVLAASGPFPIRGVQFHNAGTFDMSVFDSAWFETVSGHHATAPNQNGGLQFGWRFCNKCSCLAHNTGPQKCAAGGNHDLSESHNYAVAWDDAIA